MTLTELKTKTENLTNRIDGINTWIKSNPEVTEPNVYEIMDCNVQYAELVAEYVTYYNENGWPFIEEDMMLKKNLPRSARTTDLPFLHPELANCFLGLCTMETLREFPMHPFIKTPEAYDMYATLRMRQLCEAYTLGQTEEDRRIKRELITKSMSVLYYIWQVKQQEPDYEYDNISEFIALKDMASLYEASEEPCQYKVQIDNILSKIEESYKYKETKTGQKAPQKKKD